jgi:molybdopterin-guanine dinucleotide biosynthesis protein A
VSEQPLAPPRRVLGVVLAGGASSRFGSPKWWAQIAGQSMASRAVSALRPGTAKVVALSTDRELVTLGIEVRPDLVPGEGPLGAVRTALSWADELALDGAFVLACDLPLVSGALVQAVVSSWVDEDAVVPFGTRGPEPLCALYRSGLLDTVEAMLAGGERAPRRLLEVIRVGRFPVDAAKAFSGVADPFVNVNTREGQRIAEAELILRASQ